MNSFKLLEAFFNCNKHCQYSNCNISSICSLFRKDTKQFFQFTDTICSSEKNMLYNQIIGYSIGLEKHEAQEIESWDLD